MFKVGDKVECIEESDDKYIRGYTKKGEVYIVKRILYTRYIGLEGILVNGAIYHFNSTRFKLYKDLKDDYPTLKKEYFENA